MSASEVADNFSNVEFGAMAGTSAAMMLHRMIADEFGWRGEFQVTESLQMSAADRATALDIDEAWRCGQRAVELALSGDSGVMVTMNRISNNPYEIEFGTAPLSEVANGEKPMPDRFICDDRYFVTDACLDYLKPLVGEMPRYVRLYKD